MVWSAKTPQKCIRRFNSTRALKQSHKLESKSWFDGLQWLQVNNIYLDMFGTSLKPCTGWFQHVEKRLQKLLSSKIQPPFTSLGHGCIFRTHQCRFLARGEHSVPSKSSGQLDILDLGGYYMWLFFLVSHGFPIVQEIVRQKKMANL